MVELELRPRLFRNDLTIFWLKSTSGALQLYSRGPWLLLVCCKRYLPSCKTPIKVSSNVPYAIYHNSLAEIDTIYTTYSWVLLYSTRQTGWRWRCRLVVCLFTIHQDMICDTGADLHYNNLYVIFTISNIHITFHLSCTESETQTLHKNIFPSDVRDGGDY